MIHDPQTRIALNEVSATLKRMGDKIEAILNQYGGSSPTETQDSPFLLTAGGVPQNAPSALQDIDSSRSDYSRGLSGRI